MSVFAIMEKLDRIENLLSTRACRRWVSLKKACELTDLSESTLRRAIKRGELKCSAKTGKLLFRDEDLDRFLRS